MAGFYPLRRRAGIHPAEFSHSLPKFHDKPAACSALQATLTKRAALQSALARIEADCGTLNRYKSKADAEVDFGK